MKWRDLIRKIIEFIQEYREKPAPPPSPTDPGPGPSPPPPPPAPSPSPEDPPEGPSAELTWGFTCHGGTGSDGYGEAVRLSAEAGGTIVRSSGVNFSQMNRRKLGIMVNEAKRNGQKLMLVLSVDRERYAHLPEAWGEYVRMVAKAVNGTGAIYQIGNEQNTHRFNYRTPDPRAFAECAREAIRAIRQEDKTAVVVAGGLTCEDKTDLTNRNPDKIKMAAEEFMEAYDGLDFDAICIHHYAGEKESVLRRFCARAKEMGFPVWVTETSDREKRDGVEWLRKATRLFGGLGAEVAIWYCMNGHGEHKLTARPKVYAAIRDELKGQAEPGPGPQPEPVPEPPPPTPPGDSTIQDDLSGSTKGRQFGGILTRYGFRVNASSDMILYEIPRCDASRVEFEITGLDAKMDHPEGDCIFSMFDGSKGISKIVFDGNRFKCDLRLWNKGYKDYHAKLRVRTPGLRGPSIESSPVRFSPEKARLYRVEVEWGEGRITARIGGHVLLSAKYSGVYSPPTHIVTVGGSPRREAVKGSVVRNVRIWAGSPEPEGPPEPLPSPPSPSPGPGTLEENMALAERFFYLMREGMEAEAFLVLDLIKVEPIRSRSDWWPGGRLLLVLCNPVPYDPEGFLDILRIPSIFPGYYCGVREFLNFAWPPFSFPWMRGCTELDQAYLDGLKERNRVLVANGCVHVVSALDRCGLQSVSGNRRWNAHIYNRENDGLLSKGNDVNRAEHHGLVLVPMRGVKDTLGDAPNLAGETINEGDEPIAGVEKAILREWEALYGQGFPVISSSFRYQKSPVEFYRRGGDIVSVHAKYDRGKIRKGNRIIMSSDGAGDWRDKDFAKALDFSDASLRAGAGLELMDWTAEDGHPAWKLVEVLYWAAKKDCIGSR